MDIKDYIESLPIERQEVMLMLRNIVKDSLPKGYEEFIDKRGISFNVPLSIYPSGYHVDNEALPFIGLMNHKGHIGFYHMGIYADKKLLNWFTSEYKILNIGKLDMGKSCIRLKNMKKIPYELLKELSSRVSVEDYIKIYEGNFHDS